MVSENEQHCVIVQMMYYIPGNNNMLCVLLMLQYKILIQYAPNKTCCQKAECRHIWWWNQIECNEM